MKRYYYYTYTSGGKNYTSNFIYAKKELFFSYIKILRNMPNAYINIKHEYSALHIIKHYKNGKDEDITTKINKILED